MFIFSQNPSSLDTKRLRLIERELDRILTHPGINDAEPGPDSRLSQAVRDPADAGRKIEAVKVLRGETGRGLREAKDAVEESMSRR